MQEQTENKTILKLLLITGAVYFFLKFLTPILLPGLFAALFVTIFGPRLQRMQQKCKIPRQIGAVVFLVVGGIFVLFLLWSMVSWIVGNLPDWVAGLYKLKNSAGDIVREVCSFFERMLHINMTHMSDALESKINAEFEIGESVLLPQVLSRSPVFAGALLRFGGFMICFVIATVLLAKDYDELMNRLLEKDSSRVYLTIICGIIRYIATYVKSQAVIMTIIGGLSAAVLGVCGVYQGAMWGILAGILDALPFIGTGVVLVPIAIWQIVLGRYGIAVVIGLLYVACIFIREILEPKLIGRGMGIRPVVIVLAVYAGVKLFGLWGIIEGPLGYVIIRETWKGLKES